MIGVEFDDEVGGVVCATVVGELDRVCVGALTGWLTVVVRRTVLGESVCGDDCGVVCRIDCEDLVV